MAILTWRWPGPPSTKLISALWQWKLCSEGGRLCLTYHAIMGSIWPRVSFKGGQADDLVRERWRQLINPFRSCLSDSRKCFDTAQWPNVTAMAEIGLFRHAVKYHCHIFIAHDLTACSNLCWDYQLKSSLGTSTQIDIGYINSNFLWAYQLKSPLSISA